MISKPILFTITLPVFIRVLIPGKSENAAGKIQPIIKKITGIDTVVVIILTIILYGKALVASVGIQPAVQGCKANYDTASSGWRAVCR